MQLQQPPHARLGLSRTAEVWRLIFQVSVSRSSVCCLDAAAVASFSLSCSRPLNCPLVFVLTTIRRPDSSSFFSFFFSLSLYQALCLRLRQISCSDFRITLPTLIALTHARTLIQVRKFRTLLCLFCFLLPPTLPYRHSQERSRKNSFPRGASSYTQLPNNKLAPIQAHTHLRFNDCCDDDDDDDGLASLLTFWMLARETERDRAC